MMRYASHLCLLFLVACAVDSPYAYREFAYCKSHTDCDDEYCTKVGCVPMKVYIQADVCMDVSSCAAIPVCALGDCACVASRCVKIGDACDENEDCLMGSFSCIGSACSYEEHSFCDYETGQCMTPISTLADIS